MKKKICPHCEKSFSDRHPSATFCLLCMDWGKRHSLAGKAHALVNRAVMSGELPRPSTLRCMDCGAPAMDYDHNGWKPAKVMKVRYILEIVK